MRTPANLRGYQKRVARRIYRTALPGSKMHGTGMLVDMALGKTVTATTAVRGLIRARLRTGALVVVPKRVLETETWQDEAKLWSHTRNLRFQTITFRRPRNPKAVEKAKRDHATKSLKEATLATQRELSVPADIYLTEYDNLKWLSRLVGTKSRNRPKIKLPDILVLDESTFIKSPTSFRFKALKFRLLRFFKTVIILTGTPMPQTLLNMWAQIYVLDGGARLGTSHDRFRSRCFTTEDYHGRQWEMREGAIEYVTDLIKDLIVRLDADDWVKLPKIVPTPMPILLPERIMKLCRKHEKEMFTQLDELHTVTAVNAATLSMQCHQIANGAVYDDPELKTSWSKLHDAKLEALQEVMDDHPGQNILIPYWFKHDLIRLRATWKDGVVMTSKNAKEAKDDWNNGKIKWLFINPASSGYGLNMQFGGHMVFWFSLTWSRIAYDQLLGRLRREDNASDSIISVRPYARNTVDEVMIARLDQRGANQKTVLDLLNTYRRKQQRKGRDYEVLQSIFS